MEQRQGNKIPSQVQKLMQREAARGFNQDEEPDEKRELLRGAYCRLFEEELELMSKQHWGYTLEEKMRRFPKEAWEAFKSWANISGIQLVAISNDDQNALLNSFDRKLKYQEMTTGKRKYKSSLYGYLLATIDGF